MTTSPWREIAYDCREFQGDRPCVWHKKTGVLCVCEHYQPVQERVLMIKLDAMGDVLRTTALLPPLAEVHPNAALTWVTRSESRPLLQSNPLIHEIIDYGPDALVALGARRFDRVINLDAGRVSAGLAAIAQSPRKDGFVLDERGFVQATNDAARRWLEMGVFDDLKRAGRRTYQDVMAEILDLTGRTHRYTFRLSDAERRRAQEHLDSLGIDRTRPLIGLNTGAGGRWELKQWREDGYVELIERLTAQSGAQFVLLGGPSEEARNQRLKNAARVPLFDAGCKNPVRHFAGLVGECDVIVTGDTLAMHIALALERRAVVLFGPTSAPEIDLYGLGEKVVPDMSCLSCYKMTCDFVPNCMDLISTDMVSAAVERQLRMSAAAEVAS
jgi:ADP-heptose:LPS heptosyltransferase